MKIHGPTLLSFLVAFAGLPSSAGEPSSGSVRPKDAKLRDQKEIALYEDFRDRWEAAIASRELVSVAALYQTNGVSAIELKAELARWRQVVDEGAKPMPPYLKILSELPPESHAFWTAQAHHLTRHEITAVAMIRFQGGFQTTLPLVLVGDRLLIVPSDKISNKGMEQGGPADGSQPMRSGTNQTPGAAGSRR